MIGYYGWGGAIILVQVFCIIHAVRQGRTSWIWIILFFPLIGSIAYVASEVRVGRGGRQIASQLANVVAPSRQLDALRAELEACPSVENRLALAAECVRHRRFDEALKLYEEASSGVHKDDPEVLRCMATTQFEMGAFPEAKVTLERLVRSAPRDRAPATRLLSARITEAMSPSEAAVAAYEEALPGALGDEARCRYATALERVGRTDDAHKIWTRIVKEADRAPSRYRRENREWIRTAKDKLQPRA